jgi:hypothetical protein
VLKFAFWTLLALNAALLAYSQGLLGHAGGNEHEPTRLKNQQNADKLRLVAPPAPVAAAAVPASAPVSAPAATIACLEVGSFASAEARRFETRLASLQLGARMARMNIAGVEPTSWIVYIPPQGSKEAADKKAGELKGLGVSDFFIMNDTSPMKYAISLGVFKSETLGQALLATLQKQGVHSARIAPRGGTPARLVFQFRGIDAPQRSRIDDVAGSFQAIETKACK